MPFTFTVIDTTPENFFLYKTASLRQSLAAQPFTLHESIMHLSVRSVKKPCLIRKSTREQFVLTKEMTRVGRSRENVDIYITDNTSIGRVHAVLYLRNGRVYVEDQNSKNGTFLNGHRVSGQEELIPGARLSMSNEEFEIAFL